MSKWRLCATGIVMIPPTLLLFGPVGGFHHMYIFGLLLYMGWNGEDPDTVHFTLGEESFEVVIHPLRLAATIVIWLLILWAVVSMIFPTLRLTAPKKSA